MVADSKVDSPNAATALAADDSALDTVELGKPSNDALEASSRMAAGGAYVLEAQDLSYTVKIKMNKVQNSAATIPARGPTRHSGRTLNKRARSCSSR